MLADFFTNDPYADCARERRVYVLKIFNYDKEKWHEEYNNKHYYNIFIKFKCGKILHKFATHFYTYQQL